MNRIERVERIGLLYRRLEQLRELELHVRTVAVAAVVQRQAEERAGDLAEATLGRAALAAGEREQRMLAEAGRELIALRLARHAESRVRAETEQVLAREVHAQSRMRREQMDQVGKGQRQILQAENSRRDQAVLDDRFLSRRTWLSDRDPADRSLRRAPGPVGQRRSIDLEDPKNPTVR